MTYPKRKGARRVAEVPSAVLHALNHGELATVNLVEFLAIDLAVLLPTVARQLGLAADHPALVAVLRALPDTKPMQRHWKIAEALLEVMSDTATLEARLASHVSDVVRQWAALIVGLRRETALIERLEAIRPFAADAHFGVREIAWMSVRGAVISEISTALTLLQAWADAPDENIRRFASEVTRPRGVWCAHIEPLKQNPDPALPLLRRLRADPARYVQNSVGNWLNDAAKSRPDWVAACCAAWQRESPCKATDYICRRGLRTMGGTSPS